MKVCLKTIKGSKYLKKEKTYEKIQWIRERTDKLVAYKEVSHTEKSQTF